MASNQAVGGMEKLKDIKPLIEIDDLSVYLYWGLIVLAVLLLIAAIYLLVKIARRMLMRGPTRSERCLQALETLDWSNAKTASYRATCYARALATDERRQALFDQLVPLLARYKYKRDVEPLDDATRRQLNLFAKVCRESI